MTYQECCLKVRASSESASISVEHAAENIFTSPPPPCQPSPCHLLLHPPPWLLLQQSPPFLWILGLHQANRGSLWPQKAHCLWLILRSQEDTTYDTNHGTIGISACDHPSHIAWPHRLWCAGKHQGATFGGGGGEILRKSDKTKEIFALVQLGALLALQYQILAPLVSSIAKSSYGDCPEESAPGNDSDGFLMMQMFNLDPWPCIGLKRHCIALHSLPEYTAASFCHSKSLGFGRSHSLL